MRRVIGIGCGVLALAACVRPAEPTVNDAWVRLAAVPGRPAAAYFTLHGGREPARLVAVSAEGIARAEMHESRMTGNGMMAMDAIAGVDLPADGTVSFAPGGRHVMLFGVPSATQPGGTLKLTFRFADGRGAAAEAKVYGAGEAGPK